ncbi:glycosyltransferase family 2 protein [Candidatus Gottesmanbacteria bacterium]|nr:glycosyltransferase family 2 protein [Candidatus Gottesmanbacteria bacterium]
MKAVIILPTYNERENIVAILSQLTRVTRTISGFSFVFLVADDSSPDDTAGAVESYKGNRRDIVIVSGKKEGLGKALLRGMLYAVNVLGCDVIAQIDADLSHDPSALPKFFEKMRQGHDFVVGSRYIRGGSIPDNWGIHRKIYSIAGNAIVRFGLGETRVHDWTGGYRVYDKKYVERLKDEVAPYSGYVFQIAFLHNAIKLGANVGEVPIHFTDRRFGHSKIAPSEYIRNVLFYVAKERFSSVVHGTFGKFLVVGTIGFIINTIVLELLVAVGAHPVVGSAVGAELAIISNFFLNNSWTFGHKKIKSKNIPPKFFQFNGTSLGALVIQSGTVAIGTFLFGVGMYRWFYLLGVGIGLIWNYAMYSRVIWR